MRYAFGVKLGLSHPSYSSHAIALPFHQMRWLLLPITCDRTSPSNAIALIAHAITKEESAVPNIDIERAIERRKLFVENPEAHTYVEEEENGEN